MRTLAVGQAPAAVRTPRIMDGIGNGGHTDSRGFGGWGRNPLKEGWRRGGAGRLVGETELHLENKTQPSSRKDEIMTFSTDRGSRGRPVDKTATFSTGFGPSRFEAP